MIGAEITSIHTRESVPYVRVVLVRRAFRQTGQEITQISISRAWSSGMWRRVGRFSQSPRENFRSYRFSFVQTDTEIVTFQYGQHKTLKYL
jgi:hypothetical protein